MANASTKTAACFRKEMLSYKEKRVGRKFEFALPRADDEGSSSCSPRQKREKKRKGELRGGTSG